MDGKILGIIIIMVHQIKVILLILINLLGGTSKWENVHNNNNTPNFNNTPKPDIDLGGTPIVPDIPDTGTDYVPPTPPEIIYPPSIEDSGNNKPSKPVKLFHHQKLNQINPIYFFVKKNLKR